MVLVQRWKDDPVDENVVKKTKKLVPGAGEGEVQGKVQCKCGVRSSFPKANTPESLRPGAKHIPEPIPEPIQEHDK